MKEYNLLANTSVYVPILQYVHTHPWTDDTHLSYTVTYKTKPQEYGDWQLAADYGIQGKIVIGNDILNFHFDPSKSEPSVQDANQKVNNICP